MVYDRYRFIFYKKGGGMNAIFSKMRYRSVGKQHDA